MRLGRIGRGWRRGRSGFAGAYEKLLEACRLAVNSNSNIEQIAESKASTIMRFPASKMVLAFDVKRNLVATGSTRSHVIDLYDLATGHGIRSLSGHDGGGEVYCLAFGPDGGQALSGSQDHKVRLWDLRTGQLLKIFEGHSGAVRAVSFSPDGRLALSGSLDNAIRLWDLRNGALVGILEGHSDSVCSVAISPDGRMALSGSLDNTIRLWDLRNGALVGILEGHSDSVYSVAFSPDGRLALSGSLDKTARLWRLSNGRQIRVLEGHSSSVRIVAFSPDGRLALSGSNEHYLWVWEVKSGRRVVGMDNFNVFYQGGSFVAAFSPDGKQVISSSPPFIQCWNIRDAINNPLIQESQVQYTNAKVLLVGESGVGKTGLSNYLARNIQVKDNEPLPSTDGAWATHWPLPHGHHKDGMEREVWLWDFAGQVDYRLVHQLFMNEAAAAVYPVSF